MLLLQSSLFCLCQSVSAQAHPPLYVPPNPAAIRAHDEQLCQHQEAQERPQVTVQGGGIAIRVPNLTSRPDIPLLALTAATRHYPHVQRFRLTWNCYGGLFISHSSVFYNRTYHTLRLSVTGNVGKTENPLWYGSLFTQVTNHAIAKDAQRHKAVVLAPYHFFEASPLAFFNDLVFYGCRVHAFQKPNLAYPTHAPRVIMRMVKPR